MIFYRLPDGAEVRSVPAGAVAVLGFFDGVHKGHRKLFDTAASCDGPVVAWTFSSGERTGLLTDDATRLRLLGEAGAEYAAVADFRELKDADGPTFVSSVLKDRLAVAHAVCGESFRFGRGAAWDASALESLCRENGVGCTVVPTVSVCGVPVSSSAIREMISSGDVEGAAALLGRAHFLRLPVVKGKMIGRLLGFPTANQLLPLDLVCPADGVYVCRASFDEDGKTVRFPGVLNVGVCPTLDAEGMRAFRRDNPEYSLPDEAVLGSKVLETHVIGYDGDLYGRELRVDLCARLRDEIRFDGVDALVRAVREDEKKALEYFGHDPL